MGFDSETAFESALIKCLVEEKGWKDGVIKYPTEKDLLGQKSSLKTTEILTVWAISR